MIKLPEPTELSRPRHPSDIQSDPQGILIADPAETFLRAHKPPAPDCRTCERVKSCKEHGWPSLHFDCTNGDQYIEAPKVVLWRTE
jgi:hypothetical protein